MDLAHGVGRVHGEHQAFAAQHDVVGRVGLGDALQVEYRSANVGVAAIRGPPAGDVDHSGDHVRDHDLAVDAHAFSGGQPGAPRSGRQLEDAITGGQVDHVQHARGDGRGAPVDLVGVGTPSGGDVRPHPVDEAPHVDARSCLGRHDVLPDIDYL